MMGYRLDGLGSREGKFSVEVGNGGAISPLPNMSSWHSA
jgi:hypothetical protein